MKKMLMFTNVILLSIAFTFSAVVAFSTQKAGEVTKDVVVKIAPLDYKQKAREYVTEKYGEPFEKVQVVNESHVSLPFSKVEFWNSKIIAGEHYYSVQINKVDGSITENYQLYLDEEEKAVKKTCGKLDKNLYQEVIKLKDTETIDVEIVNNNSDTRPLQKRLNKLEVKIIDAPENWHRVYATVTRKQLKDIEAIKEVSLIERFYGYATPQ